MRAAWLPTKARCRFFLQKKQWWWRCMLITLYAASSSSMVLLLLAVQMSHNDDPTMSLLSSDHHPVTSSSNDKQKLRIDWLGLGAKHNNNNTFSSVLTQRLWEHQHNCSLPRAAFRFRNRYGMGSDLHLWAQALCNAMFPTSSTSSSTTAGVLSSPARVVTERPWIFRDDEACGNHDNEAGTSSLSCYFPNAEPTCPQDKTNDNNNADLPKLYRGRGRISNDCETNLQNEFHDNNMTFHDHFQGAAMALLFSKLSPLVIEYAEHYAHQAFHGKPIPPNLLTVHVRWGDKKDEMKLATIREYIAACQRLIQQRRRNQHSNNNPQLSNNSHGTDTNDNDVHIFLATEDPRAVDAMRHAMPPDWNLYVDPFCQQFAAHRRDEYNGNPKMAQALEGKPGLAALASLLVALEANDYVLTTASNWSLLLDELRRHIVEPRLGVTTAMVDLRPAG